MPQLTDTVARNAKPGEKPLRLFDSGGLYLEIAPAGGKYWRYKYRHSGKEKRLALGVYPRVSLKDARKKRDEARASLDQGIDPGARRKLEKLIGRSLSENSYEIVAREWFAKYSKGWTASHAERIIRRQENDVFPWLGNHPVTDIKAPELLAVLRRIESRGAIETAHRVMQNISQIFRYAIATGRAERDPAGDLRGALSPVQERHHASITNPEHIGQLLRAMDGFQGAFVTRCALRLAPLFFVRPGELRHAEWGEINFDTKEWRIPAEKMKLREQHIVPLSRQAIKILEELQPLTGSGRYLFPSERTNTRPMSENTVNAALRRMGYTKDEMTGHGFRSMASTLLNEQGWNRDAIERQLAHGERNGVRAAYNFAEYLPARRKMMQEWADYLDGLRAR